VVMLPMRPAPGVAPKVTLPDADCPLVRSLLPLQGLGDIAGQPVLHPDLSDTLRLLTRPEVLVRLTVSVSCHWPLDADNVALLLTVKTPVPRISVGFA
jgi:hypothetical protein